METNQDAQEETAGETGTGRSVVVPFMVDDTKHQHKWMGLSNLNSKTLSIFLLFGITCTFTCCVVWMWYFNNVAYFPGFSFTPTMKTELVTFVAIVTTIVTLAALYGVKSVDRGWLLVTIIGQVALINTLNFGLLSRDSASDEQIKMIDAFLLVSCTFTAWAAWSTSEKIQEEQLRKQRTLSKDGFGLNFGFDLPDMTFAGMEQWLIGTAICLICFGIIFVILGAVNKTTGPNAYATIYHMITCGMIQIVAGSAHLVFLKLGYGRARFTLTITFMFAIMAMIMICAMNGWVCFARAFFEYECDGFNAMIASNPFLSGSPIEECNERANLATAQVVYHYFAVVCCALHVWLAWRLSERVQTQALHDIFKEKPTNVSVFLKPYTLLGIKVNKPFRVYVNNLICACFFTFAAGWGFLATWYMITRVDTTILSADELVNHAKVSERTMDNYINVIVNFLAVLAAMIGLYANDQGFLLMSTLLFFTAAGYNYHNFVGEWDTLANPNWLDGGDELPENWIKDLSRVSTFFRGMTIFSGWFGAFNTFVIAEIYQERRWLQVEEVRRMSERL